MTDRVCQAKNARGQPCGRAPQRDSPWCLAHAEDALSQAKWRTQQQKGGHALKPNPRIDRGLGRAFRGMRLWLVGFEPGGRQLYRNPDRARGEALLAVTFSPGGGVELELLDAHAFRPGAPALLRRVAAEPMPETDFGPTGAAWPGVPTEHTPMEAP